MTKTVRAVYRDGTLRLLEPVDLLEDQEVQITLTTSEEESRRHSQLRDFFGSISHEDAREMMEAIDMEFEQVRPDDWR